MLPASTHTWQNPSVHQLKLNEMFTGRQRRPDVKVFHFISTKPQATFWRWGLSQYSIRRKTFTSWCCLPERISLNSAASRNLHQDFYQLQLVAYCTSAVSPVFVLFYRLCFVLNTFVLFPSSSEFSPHIYRGGGRGGIFSRRQIVVRWNNPVASVITLRKIREKFFKKIVLFCVFSILSYLRASVSVFLCVDVSLYFYKHGRNKRISHEQNMSDFRPNLILRKVILIVVYVFLLFVHVFLTLSMYSYCCPCILIVCPCILIVVYVYLLLPMYTYCCLCILRGGYPDWGFSLLFPWL